MGVFLSFNSNSSFERSPHRRPKESWYMTISLWIGLTIDMYYVCSFFIVAYYMCFYVFESIIECSSTYTAIYSYSADTAAVILPTVVCMCVGSISAAAPQCTTTERNMTGNLICPGNVVDRLRFGWCRRWSAIDDGEKKQNPFSNWWLPLGCQLFDVHRKKIFFRHLCSGTRKHCHILM